MLTIVTISFVLFYHFTLNSVEGLSGKCAGEDEGTGAQWTFCAIHTMDSSDSPEEYQGECVVPSNINEGFISYGRSNRWILIPFSNYAGNDLRILCNIAFGNVYPTSASTWNDRYCCYTNIQNMNNQFGKLTFPVSNKLSYNEDRNFMYEAVIESFKLTTNTIKIGSHLYNLVSDNKLIKNTKMLTGQALISPNEQFAGVIESDGELSVYRITDSHKLWSAPGSSGSGNNNYLEYTSNGDLVLKRADGSDVWSARGDGTNKWTNTGTVKMYDDSNLSIRNGNNEWLWGCLNHVWPWAWSNAPAIVRYGTNDKFTYRAYTNSKLKCHHDVGFGNIIKSANEPEKECQWTYDNTASGNPSSDIGHYTDWVPCGFDGSDCTGLTNNVPQWIRFGGGDDGNWEYQLVLTKDNRVYCNAAVFNYWDFEGLTHHVQGKRCERAKSPQYEFYDIIGAWVLIASCSNTNCGGLQYTLKYGVTLTNEHELTQEWGISLTRTASMDYKMFGGSQSITMSYNVAQRTLTSEVFTTEKEISVSCQSGQNFMWQWVTTAKEFIATSTQDITIKSKNYLCRTSPKQPDCAPGSCS